VSPDRPWGTAVVCGAGIAGLLAAKVLADFFDHVVVIERDVLPVGPTARPGVPQAGQIHTLLPGGRQALDQLAPGFTDALVGAGGIRTRLTSSTKRYLNGAWIPRFESELWSVLSSRVLFESVLRSLVIGTPGVELLTRRRPVRLVSDQPDAVTGVIVGALDRRGAIETVRAQLVVDALGRSSVAPAWLRDLGYEQPEQTVINGFWGYTSRYYKMPSHWDPDWLTMVIVPTGIDGDTRGAFFQRQEGDRWLCTLIGCARDFPPTDEDAMQRFAASLPVPDVSAALAVGEPLSAPTAWRRTENRLRRFDRLSRRPEGFVVIGDGVSMLNPVYAQGMSVAALSAAGLRSDLEAQRGQPDVTGLATRFQRSVAATVGLAWGLSSGADFVVPGADTQPLTLEEQDFQRRWNLVNELAPRDSEIARLRYETTMLLRSADWLYEGAVADRFTRSARSEVPELRT
jgi:2-polyprenyl-6-methoxyphenol hydroxylase-like FAD-dependent oxidoreductase